MIQCPLPFTTTTVTSEATNFICCASASPNDFSPPIDKTGIVSFVRAMGAKSFPVCVNEAKYAQAAHIHSGREHAATYATRTAPGNHRLLSAPKPLQKN